MLGAAGSGGGSGGVCGGLEVDWGGSWGLGGCAIWGLRGLAAGACRDLGVLGGCGLGGFEPHGPPWLEIGNRGDPAGN